MYKSILVPFDNSEHAKHALEHAIMIAESCDAEVTLLTVADLPDFADPTFTVAARMAGVAQMSEDQMKEVQRGYYTTQKTRLIQATADIVGDFKRISYKAMAGRPHNVIVDYAESEDYDLVVMGSRGLGALRGALGSVSFAVVRSVKLPVMLVK